MKLLTLISFIAISQFQLLASGPDTLSPPSVKKSIEAFEKTVAAQIKYQVKYKNYTRPDTTIHNATKTYHNQNEGIYNFYITRESGPYFISYLYDDGQYLKHFTYNNSSHLADWQWNRVKRDIFLTDFPIFPSMNTYWNNLLAIFNQNSTLTEADTIIDQQHLKRVKVHIPYPPAADSSYMILDATLYFSTVNYLPVKLSTTNYHSIYDDYQFLEFTLLDIKYENHTDYIDSLIYTNFYNYLDFAPPEVERTIERIYLPDTGTKAPSINLLNFADNDSISFNSSGYTLLYFWFMGCYPCMKSQPALSKINESFTKQLQIIAVNVTDKNHENLKNFINRWNIKYTVATGDKKILNDYRVQTFPSFVIIDKTGSIVYTQTGFNENLYDEVKDVILK